MLSGHKACTSLLTAWPQPYESALAPWLTAYGMKKPAKMNHTEYTRLLMIAASCRLLLIATLIIP